MNLLILKRPIELYFKPNPETRLCVYLRDILPPGSVTISEVWVDNKPYTNFDPVAHTVLLPETRERLKVKVRYQPSL